MTCLPFGQADFTASTVLQAIRSEAPRLHGLRLAYTANSAREKCGIDVKLLLSCFRMAIVLLVVFLVSQGLAQEQADLCSIPRETVTGRMAAQNGFAWNYGYDINVEDSILIVRVAINLIPARGITRPELERVKPLWEQGIERIWSNKFALKTQGRRYPIVIDASFRGPKFHHDVIVRPGSGPSDELNWNILDSPELVAHEFGHMIGMYDEYEKGALAPQDVVIDPDSIMTSNPGEGAATHARHYEEFRKWFIGKTMMSNVRIIHE